MWRQIHLNPEHKTFSIKYIFFLTTFPLHLELISIDIIEMLKFRVEDLPRPRPFGIRTINFASRQEYCWPPYSTALCRWPILISFNPIEYLRFFRASLFCLKCNDLMDQSSRSSWQGNTIHNALKQNWSTTKFWIIWKSLSCSSRQLRWVMRHFIRMRAGYRKILIDVYIIVDHVLTSGHIHMWSKHLVPIIMHSESNWRVVGVYLLLS